MRNGYLKRAIYVAMGVVLGGGGAILATTWLAPTPPPVLNDPPSALVTDTTGQVDPPIDTFHIVFEPGVSPALQTVIEGLSGRFIAGTHPADRAAVIGVGTGKSGLQPSQTQIYVLATEAQSDGTTQVNINAAPILTEDGRFVFILTGLEEVWQLSADGSSLTFVNRSPAAHFEWFM